MDPAGILPDDLALEGAPKRYANKDEGLSAVRSGEIDTLFVLPADYIASGRIEDYWTTRERGRSGPTTQTPRGASGPC